MAQPREAAIPAALTLAVSDGIARLRIDLPGRQAQRPGHRRSWPSWSG